MTGRQLRRNWQLTGLELRGAARRKDSSGAFEGEGWSVSPLFGLGLEEPQCEGVRLMKKFEGEKQLKQQAVGLFAGAFWSGQCCRVLGGCEQTCWVAAPVGGEAKQEQGPKLGEVEGEGGHTEVMQVEQGGHEDRWPEQVLVDGSVESCGALQSGVERSPCTAFCEDMLEERSRTE